MQELQASILRLACEATQTHTHTHTHTHTSRWISTLGLHLRANTIRKEGHIPVLVQVQGLIGLKYTVTHSLLQVKVFMSIYLSDNRNNCKVSISTILLSVYFLAIQWTAIHTLGHMYVIKIAVHVCTCTYTVCNNYPSTSTCIQYLPSSR